MDHRPRVGIGISMHPDAYSSLAAAAAVERFNWNDPLPILMERIAGCDGLIIYTPDLYLPAIEQATNLRVVACHSCPAETAALLARRGIRVTLTPGLWDAVADHTLALLFAAARNIPQADAAIRAGRWGREDLKVPYSGLDVFGKTLGILGLGRIGSILARRVQGFDMRLLYHDRERKPDLETLLHLTHVPFEKLLSESDFLVVLVPLNDTTRGMIGEPELRWMKPHAILVNTGRGAIVETAALYRALREGWIRAAALDVFTQEPLPFDDPLLEMENVILSPHLGGSTWECDQVMVDDVLRVLGGLDPLHPWPG